MVRVAIFDDNKHILESFTVIIKVAKEVMLCGSFQNCDNLEQKIKESRPDVVVMDIDMPGITGIEATRILKQKFPHIQIMIQTVFDDEDKIFQALCAGASGYVLKGYNAAKMEEAILEVHAGGSPITPVVARKVINMFVNFVPKAGIASENKYELTAKELEVLSLLVDGLSYKMMGEKMSVTYGTIHSHVKSIYRKLHVASMTEAVSKALKEKLV